MPTSSSALNLLLFGAPFQGGEFPTVGAIAPTLTDSSGNWTIDLEFDTPSEATPTGYTVQVAVDGGVFNDVTPDSASGTTTLTYSFTGLVDGAYQYRIQANYTEGDSLFIVSPVIQAFINLNYDSQSRFHTLAIAG